MNVFKKLSEARIPSPVHTATGRPALGRREAWDRSVDQVKLGLSDCGWGCQNGKGVRGPAPYSMLRTPQTFPPARLLHGQF